MARKQAWGHWVDGAGLTLPLKVLRQCSSVHMGCRDGTGRPWCILGSGIWSSGDRGSEQCMHGDGLGRRQTAQDQERKDGDRLWGWGSRHQNIIY